MINNKSSAIEYKLLLFFFINVKKMGPNVVVMKLVRIVIVMANVITVIILTNFKRLLVLIFEVLRVYRNKKFNSGGLNQVNGTKWPLWGLCIFHNDPYLPRMQPYSYLSY